ncbi:matrix metalloproteinase-21-like [Lampetra fluviatilis]
MDQRTAAVTYLAFPLLVATLTGAEMIYHRRDHSDISTNHISEPVKSADSAEHYLSKYGWIEEVNWEEVPYHDVPVPTNDDPAPRDTVELIEEADSSLRSEGGDAAPHGEPTQSPAFALALEHFQEANGLPVTGVLDEATKEAMNRPRCGVPDQPEDLDSAATATNDTANDTANGTARNDSAVAAEGQPSTSSSPSAGEEVKGRKRRSLQRFVDRARSKRARDEGGTGRAVQVFSKRQLKWRLIGEGYSQQLSVDDQRAILRLAFRMWSEVTPLEFIEDLTTPTAELDVKLGFGRGRHLGCSQVFDGSGQEFAHAWHLGDVHFDDDEHFTKPRSEEGISLLKVAVHEIGHVLGLPHIYRSGSVMQPNYIPKDSGFELDWNDRKAIQRLYGVCEGSFNAVFDWIREERNRDGQLIRRRFNTYFFRRQWYWMYENAKNKTRSGDPAPIARGWKSIPDSVDAYVHVSGLSRDEAYFFKGTQYWRYDNQNDCVYTEDPQGLPYPRPISEKFPNVPHPIDTAFFDGRDQNIYFFKANNVTAFSVNTQQKVSGYPKRVTDVFPAVVAGDHPGGNLDAVYYSYSHMAIFFFKGGYFWKVVDDRDRQANPALPYNGLLARRRVSDHWFDICDVHQTMLLSNRN